LKNAQALHATSFGRGRMVACDGGARRASFPGGLPVLLLKVQWGGALGGW